MRRDNDDKPVEAKMEEIEFSLRTDVIEKVNPISEATGKSFDELLEEAMEDQMARYGFVEHGTFSACQITSNWSAEEE